MSDETEEHEVTADDIGGAILLMLNTLHLLNGLEGCPFPENVAEAVERFDKPALRSELARRLWGPEREERQSRKDIANARRFLVLDQEVLRAKEKNER